LILSGILIFQIVHLRGIIPLSIRDLYMDLTVKLPLALRFQIKMSFPPLRETPRTFTTRSSHWWRRSPLIPRLKETLSGLVLITMPPWKAMKPASSYSNHFELQNRFEPRPAVVRNLGARI
jgi:hypothetical protein